MKYNHSGNSYPTAYPIYTIRLLKDIHGFKTGDTLDVMSSLNPTFPNHWRVNDSVFIKKEHTEII